MDLSAKYHEYIAHDAAKYQQTLEAWSEAAGHCALPAEALNNALVSQKEFVSYRSRAVKAAECLVNEARGAIAQVASSAAPVISIEPAGGDRHCGFEVLRLGLSDGHAIAARPWPTGAPRILEDIAKILDHPYAVPPWTNVEVGGRSWQLVRWVTPGGGLSHDELDEFYQAMGALAAAGWVVGATDLHSENLVANYLPWVIDAEFIFEPLLISSSLSSIGLIDPASAPVPVQGALDGPVMPACWNKPLKGEDRSLAPHRETTYSHRPIRRNATSADPREHLPALEWGFRDSVNVLFEVYSDFIGEGIVSRRIMRPTAIYQAFLNELDCPSVLPREVRATAFVPRLMKVPGVPGFDSHLIARLEAQDLAVGDIPHFLSEGEESGLIHTSSGIHVPLFATAGSATVSHRARALPEQKERLCAELLAAAARATRS